MWHTSRVLQVAHPNITGGRQVLKVAHSHRQSCSHSAKTISICGHKSRGSLQKPYMWEGHETGGGGGMKVMIACRTNRKDWRKIRRLRYKSQVKDPFCPLGTLDIWC
ncbi:hypothetical protein BsWGS_23180 [Bradybaena similaris]